MIRISRAGGLKQKSQIRPNRLFTADTRIILYRTGHLKSEKVREALARVVEILKGCVGV